jgi:two-component system sensor histidine kinase UhpB
MSLRTTLLRTIVIVLLATLALGSVLIYWHSVRKVQTEMRAAIAVGSRIATNAVDDVDEISDPRRRLELLVRDFDGDRHLQASLVDAEGRLAAASKLQPPENQVPGWLFRLLAGEAQSVVVALPAMFDRYGSVVLRADPRNEVAEVWNDAQLYMAILAVFCALTALALYVSLGRALRPLQDLKEGFGRIGRGDYEARVPVVQPREFARLNAGFNQMAARLSEMETRTSRLREQLETVQDEERVELARNLHDEVSPLLFSIEVDALTIRQLAAQPGEKGDEIAARAGAIQQAATQLKRNVRAILGQLRPAGSHGMPLKSEVENLVAFWRSRHPDRHFEIELPEASWGSKLDSTLHAIIREALGNALQHSHARRIGVRLREIEGGKALEAVVEDDGGGLRSPQGRGYGLIGMRERAAMLGGSLEVRERENPAGVVVRAIFPLEARARGKRFG